jgi:capsular exopolysaccharide synthesis family protein
MAGIGVLNQNLKLLMERNSRELSTIKANLFSAAGERKIKTLLVTSCYPQEGKTISAISLAIALAELNDKVILIDGNLQAPKIYKLFNIDPVPGLTDLLSSDALKDYHAVRKTEYRKLMIIPHGSEMSKSLNIFESEMFKNRLDFLKQYFDFIIIDGPAVFGSSDVSVISKYLDGTVLVVECETTKWEVVQQVKDRINNIGGNILGVVLNKRNYYIPRMLYG